jgi:hypothetical protein
MTRAFAALGDNAAKRTQPDGAAGYGYGRVTLPKGIGLSVWIENPSGSEHATQVTVQQFTDGTFTTGIGAAIPIPAGFRGLYPIHGTLTNIGDGNLYVRITKTNAGEFSEGLLVFDYFPYLGA